MKKYYEVKYKLKMVFNNYDSCKDMLFCKKEDILKALCDKNGYVESRVILTGIKEYRIKVCNKMGM